MKKFLLKAARYRKMMSMILILALFICTVMPPVEGRAAQNRETAENAAGQEGPAGFDDPGDPSKQEHAAGDVNEKTDEHIPAAEEEGKESPSGTVSSSGEGPEGPAPSPEDQTGPEDPAEMAVKEGEEAGGSDTEEAAEPSGGASQVPAEDSLEEAPAEAADEDLLMKAPLLGASASGSIPAPLGNVTVGREGRTGLPVTSRYVDYTRCWYVVHNNVKYWAVCARASASGSVPPESPDSKTVSCRYNRLNEEVVNGISAWQKSGENSTTVPIKLDQGHNARLARAVLVSMFTRAEIWKESFSSFSLSYAAAHLLVSDLLFGDDDAAYGDNYDLVFHQMKSKVEKWLEDPENGTLTDSCDAYIAYRWDGGMARGRQSVVWVEGLPGVMDLHKSAEDQDGNPVEGQDLTGTTYVVYKDRECSERAKDVYGKDAVFVCDRNGDADQLVLPIGTYYLKETKAAPGMLLDEEISAVTLIRSTEFGDGINYCMKEAADAVAELPGLGNLVLRKRDRETGTSRGGASLEGAVYDLIVDQDEGVADEQNYYKKGEVYGSLTTDREGNASMQNIPEGDYILREKSASRGYRVSAEERKVLIEDGKTVSLTGEEALDEDIVKAPFSFAKAGSDDKRMAGVSFRVTCRDSGESWEIRTGEDGTYDSLKEEDPLRQELVYGTYLLEELPCDANSGFTLCSPVTFKVEKETALDLGTFMNYRAPSAKTVLTDKNGDRYLKASGKISLTDTVTLHDMYEYKGKEIRIRGLLVDPDTGREEASAEKTLVLSSAEQDVAVEFTLDASGLGGKSLAAFEYVYDSEGNLITKHEDPEDARQTVHFPGLQTSAVCDNTKDQVMPSSGRIVILDTIHYRGLEGGKTYRAEGILYDAGSGEPFLCGGSRVISSVTFTADPSGEGTALAEFVFDAPEDFAGKVLVAAEALYDSRGELMAEHKDLKDKKQTVCAPGIRTEAEDLMTGDHSGTLSRKTTLRDKVTYTGLFTDEDYEISGYLMVRETGEPLLVDGRKVTASRTFRPEASEGTVFLDFTFDSTVLSGKTIVCFEELYHKGIRAAAHADIRDLRQSIVYPGIRTKACDIRTGDHLGISLLDRLKGSDGGTLVTDRAELTGLLPGCTYLVRGKLTDQETGQTVKDQDGKEITAEIEFTASAENETKELVFRTDGPVSGKTLVVCEDLIHNDVIIASHNDPADEDQSIHYPEIRTSAEDMTTESHTGAAVEKAIVRDRAFYENLIPSTEEHPVTYTMKGKLMIRSTGEPLLDREGKEITSQVTFSPESPSGSVNLTFSFDASLLQGETVVCFESLYREDILVTVHADLEDKDQSISYPSITTRAEDDRTGTHTGAAGEENTLTDLVHYDNLLPGTYVVRGVLTDAGTGLPFKDADGREVRAEKTFTAEEMSGQVPMTFKFRSEDLAGRTLTVFETLYTEDGLLLAAHEDSSDKEQMIFYPEIITEAEDTLTGDHTGPVKEEVTVTDHVYYRNLIPSAGEEPREYTLKGVLMIRSTGEPLTDENGEAVTAEAVFSPEAADGCQDLVFTFSSSLLAGETVVCFESLYENDIEVAAHADLEDSRQSIYYPSIGTAASVKGEKNAAAAGRITVEDMVEYRNLVPGTEYELTGILMDKKTGEPLTAGGKQVTARKSFVPEEADGSVEMNFTFDAAGLGGKTLVVFEALFENGIELACHEDLEDEKQSVLLTPPSNPPKTGDGMGTLLSAFLLLSGLSGSGILVMIKRKAKRR